MANRRMLSKTISISVKVNRLSDKEALLYTWLISHLDDFGRIEGEPEVIKALVVPMRKVGKKEIGNILARLSDQQLVLWYVENGKCVLQLLNFESFQTNLHKRTDSKLPEPSDRAIYMTSQNFREILGNSDLTELNLTELKRTEFKGRSEPTDFSFELEALLGACSNGETDLLKAIFSIPKFPVSPGKVKDYLVEKTAQYGQTVVTSAVESFVDKKRYGEALTSSPLGQLTTFIKNEKKWTAGQEDERELVRKRFLEMGDEG